MTSQRSMFASGLALAMAFGGASSLVNAQDTMPKAGFTQEQADRGLAEYTRSCADCHGANLDDGEFGGPPLKGVGFREKWFNISADVLYGFISTQMPPDRPGQLGAETYADLTAYILLQNGKMAGTEALPADLTALSELHIDP